MKEIDQQIEHNQRTIEKLILLKQSLTSKFNYSDKSYFEILDPYTIQHPIFGMGQIGYFLNQSLNPLRYYFLDLAKNIQGILTITNNKFKLNCEFISIEGSLSKEGYIVLDPNKYIYPPSFSIFQINNKSIFFLFQQKTDKNM